MDARSAARRIDRINDCAFTDARFEAPTDAELARARLFSEAGGEPIRIRLAPRAAEWALARPGGLRIVKRSDREGSVVEVTGVSEEWATRFALSFGGEAEVVAPASARRRFAEAVRLTLARYD